MQTFRLFFLNVIVRMLQTVFVTRLLKVLFCNFLIKSFDLHRRSSLQTKQNISYNKTQPHCKFFLETHYFKISSMKITFKTVYGWKMCFLFQIFLLGLLFILTLILSYLLFSFKTSKIYCWAYHSHLTADSEVTKDNYEHSCYKILHQ